MTDSRARGRYLMGFAALLLLAGVGLGVERGLTWRDLRAQDRDGAAAVEAATAEVEALITISAATVPEDVAKLVDGATGSFREEYEQQADDLVKAVRDSKVTSTGRVVSAALTRLDDDEATVIVAATGSVKNVQSPKPEPRHYRLSVKLENSDDQWLVSGLEFVA
jgi:Mce-associated membrane protein